MSTRFERPGSIDEATRLLAAGPWAVLAGGTDLYPAHVGRPLASPLLDVTAIARAARHPARRERLVDRRDHDLERRRPLPICRRCSTRSGRRRARVGGVQIQNTGTVAGNLCNASPAADGTPVLMALGASAVLRSERGERQVPVEQFVLGNRRTVRADRRAADRGAHPGAWRGRALGVHQARRPALPDDLDDHGRGRARCRRHRHRGLRRRRGRQLRGDGAAPAAARGASRRRTRRQRLRRAGRARRPGAADADRRPARQRRVPPRRDARPCCAAPCAASPRHDRARPAGDPRRSRRRQRRAARARRRPDAAPVGRACATSSA